MQSFIKPLPIHKEYGVKDIPGVKVLDIKPSHSGKHKYAITIEYKNKTKVIHYGHRDYEHYKDRTPLKIFSSSDHLDSKRRHSYLSRSSGIKSNKAMNDPFSANRYAMITLW